MSKQREKKPVDVENISKRQTPKDSSSASSHTRLLPKDTSKVKKVYWSFGFRFFEQIPYFGLSHVDVGWFVSVLQRLKDASNMEYVGMSQVLEDGYRYHEISWSAQNIPLQRNDFSWLNKSYLENEQEYPFCQFHISKGKGRVIGFWDENNIFQVLLLDPLHNLQPSSYTNYQLRDCYPAKSEIDSLHFDLHNLKSTPCNVTECHTFKKLTELPKGINNTNIVIAYLDDDFFKAYESLLKTKSISELIEAGIISLT